MLSSPPGVSPVASNVLFLLLSKNPNTPSGPAEAQNGRLSGDFTTYGALSVWLLRYTFIPPAGTKMIGLPQPSSSSGKVRPLAVSSAQFPPGGGLGAPLALVQTKNFL